MGFQLSPHEVRIIVHAQRRYAAPTMQIQMVHEIAQRNSNVGRAAEHEPANPSEEGIARSSTNKPKC